jgi:ATP-dependent DNA helicase UvrD/PcrA
VSRCGRQRVPPGPKKCYLPRPAVEQEELTDVSVASSDDPVRDRIVAEEVRCLERVQLHLAQRTTRRPRPSNPDYDTQMLALRDEIAAARLEDVPPLLEQMERLQGLAAHRRERTEGVVDPRSPYFGHLVLQEGDRRREVLIGRTTYLDTQSGVRIVDWRDAPVSRLFYRYEEGDEYEEVFGEREVSGAVRVRRSVTIVDGVLRRITTPGGTYVRTKTGAWRTQAGDAARLGGGQGTAARAEQVHRPGKLGVADAESRENTHLREVTGLIDQRQFELITRPDSGLVVIQGGAGSGKTTIGLHRLAYLAYQDPRRFRADRMLVIVFNDALCRYISEVLPALGVTDVGTRTYEHWASRLVSSHLKLLPRHYRDDTPSAVTRLKKHPAMLGAIDAHVKEFEATLAERIGAAAGEAREAALAAWKKSAGEPVVHRVHRLSSWTAGRGSALSTDARVSLERVLRDAARDARDVVTHWADLLTDRAKLERSFAGAGLSASELREAHAWSSARIGEVLSEIEERRDSARDHESVPPGEEPDEPRHGVDGVEIEERAALDREDGTLLLRLIQKFRGPLLRGGKGKEPLVYEHVFVDEAQDLSPVELAVVLDTVSRASSVTLAGDVSQRLLMDNGFSDWKTVLGELGLSHVEVEPLKLSYRSTQEIIDFAKAVLGPLADEEQCTAVRHGAPVELFGFAHSGDAVGFAAEALRELMQAEPRASVAVIARYPEQADIYYEGLEKGEVANLRRIAAQDFPFKPGVDVTDVRAVKGLEFDYVVLVEGSDASYPADDEARHLLHIGATRAAHQLWVLTTGKASPLIPEELTSRGY